MLLLVETHLVRLRVEQLIQLIIQIKFFWKEARMSMTVKRQMRENPENILRNRRGWEQLHQIRMFWQILHCCHLTFAVTSHNAFRESPRQF